MDTAAPFLSKANTGFSYASTTNSYNSEVENSKIPNRDLNSDMETLSNFGNITFNSRCVRQSDTNVLYFPSNKGKHDLECVIFKSRSVSETCIFTLYTGSRCAALYNFGGIMDKYNYISESRSGHTADIHKRTEPKSRHCHFVLDKDQDPNDFLSDAFSALEYESNAASQLFISVQYFMQYPDEPGLHFEDGSYSLNGGAKTLDENEQTETGYMHGPYRLHLSQHDHPQHTGTL